jgi:hypothetical protein
MAQRRKAIFSSWSPTPDTSLEVYKAGLNGIYYRSRYGHDLENWALFEPFQIRKRGDSEAIRVDDPDLLAACEILGIQIGN